MEDLYYDLKCPSLDLGKRMGWTEYIDFITWEEVTQPIMKGTDYCDRKFIVIKFVVNQTRIMQTFFQRYSRGACWMGCGHATINLIDTSGGMSDSQVEFIRQITEGKKCILTQELSPCYKQLINKEVELYDEKRESAAIVIQKAWRLCRYNPRYLMCHCVQNRNLDDILSKK